MLNYSVAELRITFITDSVAQITYRKWENGLFLVSGFFLKLFRSLNYSDFCFKISIESLSLSHNLDKKQTYEPE